MNTLYRILPTLLLLVMALAWQPDALASGVPAVLAMTQESPCRFTSGGGGRLTAPLAGLMIMAILLILVARHLLFSTPSAGILGLTAFLALALIALAVHTYRLYQDNATYGNISLTLESCPVETGGQAIFSVDVPRGMTREDTLKAELLCETTAWEREIDDSKGWRETRSPLWSGTTESTGQPDRDGLRFRFFLELPARLPGNRSSGPPPLSSESAKVAGGVVWTLRLRHGGGGGTPLDRSFPLPVREAEGSDYVR